MATNYTDTTALTDLVDSVYTKLAILKAEASSDYWGKDWFDTFELSQYGAGSTIKVPVYSAAASASGTLTETDNGDGVSLSATTADITLAEYGNFTTITEKVSFTAKDNTLVNAVSVMGQNMGHSLDDVAAAVYAAGTNVIYGGDATSSATLATGDSMTVDLLIEAVKDLKTNNAPTFDDGMYVAILSPKQAMDLKQDSDFQSSVSYGAYEKIARGYIGTFQGCHVIESANAPTASESVTVQKAIVFGQNALGEGFAYEPKMVITPPSDELKRFTNVGWKALCGFAILVDEYVVRIESD